MTRLSAGSSCYIPTMLHYDKVASGELVATREGQNWKGKDLCKFPFSNLSDIVFQLGGYYIPAISLEPLKS